MPIGTTFPEVLAAAQPLAGWAFGVLYRDLAPALTGYLRLQGAAEPDDLASETFIGVITGLGAFRGDEAGLRAWVFTIGRQRHVSPMTQVGLPRAVPGTVTRPAPDRPRRSPWGGTCVVLSAL